MMNKSEEDHKTKLNVYTPPDISQMATLLSLDLLPRKSRHIFMNKGM